MSRRPTSTLTLPPLADPLAEAADDPGSAIAAIALGAATIGDAAGPLLALLDRIAPSAGKALGIVAERGAAVRWVGGSGIAAPAAGMRIPLPESIARADAADAPAAPAAPAADAALAVGGFALPLVARGELVGALAVAGSRDAPVTPAGAAALRRLAPALSLAVAVHHMGAQEERHHAREAMLATALATLDQPVLILALDGRVAYANLAARREYGWDDDALPGLPADALVAPGGARQGDGIPAGAGEWEQLHQRRDGTRFPAWVTVSPIGDGAGMPVGRVVGVRNLTDERRLADRLRQREQLAALGELVAGVAHELNNPLAGISAFAQLLLEEPLAGEQEESVRLIKREADRAVGVVRDLLLFARRRAPRGAAVDVNEVLRLALRLRGFGLRDAGVAVELALDAALPRLAADEEQLRRLFLNVVVNAEQAMRHADVRRLTVRSAQADGRIVIEILDTGCGMSDHVRRRIFEPFFTTRPAGEGTGLGLSVSYGIVAAHGGAIDVETRPGGGSTFRITLPCRESGPATPPEVLP